MTIRLSFFSFVAPIATIEAKYPGGWAQFVIDEEISSAGRAWFDEDLVCFSTMDSSDIEDLYDHWIELGFEPTEKCDGKQVWKDCCVIEAPFGRPTLPCDWVQILDGGDSACLRVAPKL